MFRPTRQLTRLLGNLLVAVMLLGNTTAVWALTIDVTGDAAEQSQMNPCHAEHMAQDTEKTVANACCDPAQQCTSVCQCPAMASTALFAHRLFLADTIKMQLHIAPQTTPIQSDPDLFLQPPRQVS